MLSTSLFDTYYKNDFGQTIDFQSKTFLQKTTFVLNFNTTGVLRTFLFDVFLSIIKPFFFELPAYII